MSRFLLPWDDDAPSFNDADVRAIHSGDCGLLSCGNEINRVALRHDPRECNFYQTDRKVG